MMSSCLSFCRKLRAFINHHPPPAPPPPKLPPPPEKPPPPENPPPPPQPPPLLQPPSELPPPPNQSSQFERPLRPYMVPRARLMNLLIDTSRNIANTTIAMSISWPALCLQKFGSRCPPV